MLKPHEAGADTHPETPGNLWVGGEGAVCRWQKGKPDCYEMTGQTKSAEKFGVYGLASDSNGDLWADGGPTGIWRLAYGHWKRYNEFPDLKLHSTAMLSDRGSGLWIGDLSNGLIRRVNGRTEHFTRADGLSDDAVTAIFEDREGNVWVATSAGLDRFRNVKIATLTSREGLPLAEAWSIAASKDASLWIAGELVHMKVGKATSYEVIRGIEQSILALQFLLVSQSNLSASEYSLIRGLRGVIALLHATTETFLAFELHRRLKEVGVQAKGRIQLLQHH